MDVLLLEGIDKVPSSSIMLSAMYIDSIFNESHIYF